MTTDDELQKIRERRTQELMRLAEQRNAQELRESQQEELKQSDEAPTNISEADKLNVMRYFLAPDAFDYWKGLYDISEKNVTAETIFINVLYLVKIGYLEGKQVSRLGIKKLERKIDNIPSTITIKRKGEKERSRKLD